MRKMKKRRMSDKRKLNETKNFEYQNRIYKIAEMYAIPMLQILKQTFRNLLKKNLTK